MSNRITHCALALAMTAFALPMTTSALEAGDWLVRGGLHHVSPKSNNGRLADGTLAVDVGSNTRPSGTVTYMLTPRIGVELLVAIPFQHDISIDGLGKVGRTRHLPPTLSVQYHFNTGAGIRPYVGAGLNYTRFFGTRTRGALEGNSLSLRHSFGLGAQAGVDVSLGGDWFLNAEVRYLDIDTRVRLNGDKIGTVNIDPVAFGLGIGRRF